MDTTDREMDRGLDSELTRLRKEHQRAVMARGHWTEEVEVLGRRLAEALDAEEEEGEATLDGNGPGTIESTRGTVLLDEGDVGVALASVALSSAVDPPLRATEKVEMLQHELQARDAELVELREKVESYRNSGALWQRLREQERQETHRFLVELTTLIARFTTRDRQPAPQVRQAEPWQEDSI